MFGFLKRKKKERVYDVTHYPLDTCKHFYLFVKQQPELSLYELTNSVMDLSCKPNLKWLDVFDLVKTTRDALPKQNNLVESEN